MNILKTKYRELFLYIIFGGLTTLVNYIAYFLCTNVFLVHYIISNIIAWIISVLFAFIVNKMFVFQSKKTDKFALLHEMGLFCSARIVSGIFETVLLFICVTLFHFEDGIIKILASVIVVILNYFFSKFIIFKK